MNDCRIGSSTEVLIVGAGPAGLACAIASAQQGLHVELIDAIQPPIDKACGEGLMPDSLESLAAIGFDLDRDLNSIETHLLRGIRFIGDSKYSAHYPIAEARFPANPGRGIRRTVLHQLLFDRAARLGVRFHWGNSVQGIAPIPEGTLVHTNRQTLRARYVVGADGPQSRIARWSGLTEALVYSRRFGLRQRFAISPWSEFVEVYWNDYGQAYVTPVSSNEICVALIAKERMADPMEAIASFPALWRHLTSASISGRPRGAVTLGRTLHRVAAGHIALIGDASGSVDAVTGEGLALCFRQAAALASALRAGDLAGYQQEHRRIQRLPAFMSRMLLLMDRSPRLRRRTFEAFERRPVLFQGLLQTHIGHSPVHFFGADGLLATGLHILAS